MQNGNGYDQNEGEVGAYTDNSKGDCSNRLSFFKLLLDSNCEGDTLRQLFQQSATFETSKAKHLSLPKVEFVDSEQALAPSAKEETYGAEKFISTPAPDGQQDLDSESNNPAAATSNTDKIKLAEKLFLKTGGLTAGASALPAERTENYRSQTEHARVAAMVKEYLEYGNRSALFDLRKDAGRPEWIGASSIAPTALHRTSVVDAVQDYETALKTGNVEKQKLALLQVMKLRQLKLGGENDYRQVHAVIDKFLKDCELSNSAVVTDRFLKDGEGKARGEFAREYKHAATAFAQFLTADSHGQRMKAYENFQMAMRGYPEGKSLEYGARLGDYMSALRLKEVLSNPKSAPKTIEETLQAMQKTSPELLSSYLNELLKNFKNAPALAEKFANVDKLTCEELCKMLAQEDQLAQSRPHLRKATESGEVQKVIKEHESLIKSKHSPADLMRVGVKNAGEESEFLNERVESANTEIKESNKKFQELERAFLRRGATNAEREKALDDLNALLKDAQILIGDNKVLASTDKLEALNAVLLLRDLKNPKAAAAQLEKLQQLAIAGDPFASKLLDQLCPAQQTTPEELIRKLKDGDTDALTGLSGRASFVDSEMNKQRVTNLTYNFRGNESPDLKDLNALEVLIKEELSHGNKGATPWLDWVSAARITKAISIGSGNAHKQQLQLVEQLGDLAKQGNTEARRALLGILLTNVDAQEQRQFARTLNDGETPPLLIPNLTSIEAYRRELRETAFKGYERSFDGKDVVLDRETAMALAMVLGSSNLESNQLRIERLLESAIKGSNSAASLLGVFDALDANSPGGTSIARALLHGANRPEFAKMFETISQWAVKGDNASVQVMSGILAGRRENPDLIAQAREVVLKCAADPTRQKEVLEQLLLTHGRDIKSAKSQHDAKNPADFTLVEVMADIAGSATKDTLPERLKNRALEIVRTDLTWFKQNFNNPTNLDRKNMSPAQETQLAHILRGFMSLSPQFTKADIELIGDNFRTVLAESLREKTWDIKEDLRSHFVNIFLQNLDKCPHQVLDSFCSMTKILSPQKLDALAERLQDQKDPAVKNVYAQTLLNIIGSKDATPELVSAALKKLETSKWFTDLDEKVRIALSDYVRGKMPPLEQLNKSIEIIGDCGIKPPIALVVSRMGMPLTKDFIDKVEAAERNIGDRETFLKILERSAKLNALPAHLNPYGKVDIKELIRSLATSPLSSENPYAYLATAIVDNHLQQLEDKLLGRVLTRVNAQREEDGLSALSLEDLKAAYKRNSGLTESAGAADVDFDKSVATLRQVTKDGHNTSYWWLAAGGAGYLAKRFGTGGTKDEFENKQRDALQGWRKALAALGESMMETQVLKHTLEEISTARKIGNYVSLIGGGTISKSDLCAMDLLKRCGSEQLLTVAPFIHQGIFGNTFHKTNSRVQKPFLVEDREGGEIWKRFIRLHVTDVKMVPRFLKTDEALRFLVRPDLDQRDNKLGDKYHIFRSDVHDVLVNEAFKQVDSDERMMRAFSTYYKLTTLVGSTKMLFHDGMAGHRGPQYTQIARDMGGQIEKTLEELRQQAPEIRKLIQELKEAREKAVDETAKQGLDDRINKLEDMMLGYVPNSTTGTTNSKRYNELKEMCRVMRAEEFDPETFGTWLRDNAVTIGLMTAALAGVALAAPTGGASSIITMVAVAALIATVSYLTNEAWKASRKEWFGAAYGSEFLDCVMNLCGIKDRDTNTLQYRDGQFLPPKQMDEVFGDAGKEISKETLLFLFAGAFGKLVGAGLKGFSNPATKLAGRDLVQDAVKVATAFEKASVKNPFVLRWGRAFVNEWVSQLPWAIVAATSEGIMHDGLKDLNADKETMQFVEHVSAILFVTLCHRVHGHVMRPKVLAGGNVEIPYDKAQFMNKLKTRYNQSGKPMPEILAESESAIKLKVGNKEISLIFKDANTVAADLTKRGVKPDPVSYAEAGKQPSENPKLLSGKTELRLRLCDGIEPETLSKLRSAVAEGKVTESQLALLDRAFDSGLIKLKPGETFDTLVRKKILDANQAARTEFFTDLTWDIKLSDARKGLANPLAPVDTVPEPPGGKDGGLLPVQPESYKVPNSSTPVEYCSPKGTKPGYVVTDANGQTLFVTEPTAKGVAEQIWTRIPDGQIPLRCGTGVDGLYFDPATRKLYSVRSEGDKLKASEITTEVIKIESDRELCSPYMNPVVRQRQALELDGGRVKVSSAPNSRGITIGDGPKCDILAGKADNNGTASAVVWGGIDGFYVKRNAGGQTVVIRRGNSAEQLVLQTNKAYRLNPGDTLVVDGKTIPCTAATEPAFLKRPLPHTAGDAHRGPSVDFKIQVKVSENFKNGGSYEDSLLPNEKVPRRVVDPSHPVIKEILKEADSRIQRKRNLSPDKKLTPDEEIMEIAKLVHDLSTPYDTKADNGSVSRIKNDGKLNTGADKLDAAIGRDGRIQLGDLVAFKRMVCLDQAMLLKTILDARGFQCEVVSGKYGNGAHAWCAAEVGGKKLIYDPRNINSQKSGIPVEKATDLRPYDSPTQRLSEKMKSAARDPLAEDYLKYRELTKEYDQQFQKGKIDTDLAKRVEDYRIKLFEKLDRDQLVSKVEKLDIEEEAKSELKDYLFNEKRLFEGWEQDSKLLWRREQLVDLLNRLETMPDRALSLVIAFKRNPLRYAAYMKNPELISKRVDEFVVIARAETRDCNNYEDWTDQFSTAANYYFDKPRDNRHIHLVVISKDNVSPALWRWATTKGLAIDMNKQKNNHWVDRRARNVESGESEKTCPEHLQGELRKLKGSHYSVRLD